MNKYGIPCSNLKIEEECIPVTSEIEDKLPIHLERMQKDKDSYTYLEEAENFITKIDGKCTERIINEMLKITGEK